MCVAGVSYSLGVVYMTSMTVVCGVWGLASRAARWRVECFVCGVSACALRVLGERVLCTLVYVVVCVSDAPVMVVVDMRAWHTGVLGCLS